MQSRRALPLELGVRVGREWQEYLSVRGCMIRTRFNQGLTAIPMTMIRSKKSGLAPRGCLVRVTSRTGRHPRERWFAVGIYFQRMAEAAVCDLPQIEPTDVVFAYRRLQPSEIETLG